MKKIKINGNCKGCGLCVVNSQYFQENEEGNAQVIPGKVVQDEDLEHIKRVISECPENAIELVDTGVSKAGKAGAQEVVRDLKKKFDAINVESISKGDVKLNVKDYHISIPYSAKDGRRDYSSESSARSAARDEFDRLCYSQSAYRPILKKVFVEYKVKVLKPYYNCEDVPESAYYKYNQIIREYLADAYAEICELIGGNKVPPAWKSFSHYLNRKDYSIEFLESFDERSTSSGIIAELKDLSYSSLSDYVDYMDIDYDERYAGEGLFGTTKYKKVWYFSDFRKAAERYFEDLTWAIGYQSSDIEEEAVHLVNSALRQFEKEMREVLSRKISELEGYIK